MSRRRRRVRTARWLAFYAAVLFAVAGLSLASGEISVGFTVLLAGLFFVLLTWLMWKRGRSAPR